MYDPVIYNKITLLSYVIDDIRDLEEDMEMVSDPELLLEYKQEMKELIIELNEVSTRCVSLLRDYIEECKKTNEPICLDFYRVFKELTRTLS